jgi:polysaccharide deacetylase family protein (PEP-CTERM system associated)
MMRILSCDVEEWFHLLENEAVGNHDRWDGFPVRIHENVDRLLDILEKTNTRATFFVLGWIARKYPQVVKKIAERYEIGSHTMYHSLVWQHDRKAFQKDVMESVHLLEDVTGRAVKYFRAPGFSIRESEPWAFEVLHDCGIEVDSSVFVARHAHGGIPSYGEAAPSTIEYNGCRIKELPITPQMVAGQGVMFSGGGYFRLLPYPLIRRWTRQSDYLMSYIHPRDLDPGQPVLQGLSAMRRFKSYVGLLSAASKLERWLTDFRFTDIAETVEQVDWERAPVVRLETGVEQYLSVPKLTIVKQ